jgi:osmoprotectant transport system substrate-binding protein
VRSGPFGRAVVAALVAAVLVAPAACSSGDGPPASDSALDTVRFGSYDFPENQVLVELYAAAARRAGVPVEVQHGIGTREVLAPALQQGAIDVVVDYLGTALDFARPGTPRLPREPGELHAALSVTLGARGVEVLAAAPAEDQNGFAVRTAFAAEYQVGRLSELAPFAGDLVFGGPPECPTRPLCLPGLREVYGLEFAQFVAMPSRAATVEALLSGQIDIGLLETTEARLTVAPVLLLHDDLGLQPHENVVPLVRREVLERWGEGLRAALDEVSARLTTQVLVELNRAVQLDGMSPAQAAERWLGG